MHSILVNFYGLVKLILACNTAQGFLAVSNVSAAPQTFVYKLQLAVLGRTPHFDVYIEVKEWLLRYIAVSPRSIWRIIGMFGFDWGVSIVTVKSALPKNSCLRGVWGLEWSRKTTIIYCNICISSCPIHSICSRLPHWAHIVFTEVFARVTYSRVLVESSCPLTEPKRCIDWHFILIKVEQSNCHTQ